VCLPVDTSGNLARRSARLICKLLIFIVFAVGANTKFVWKFLGSPTQALAINSLRLCVCGDSCSDADELNRDWAFAAVKLPIHFSQALVKASSPEDEAEHSIRAPGHLAPPAWWHRPPPRAL
jgi:hypothetical protein